MSVDEAVRLIRGERGSEVVLIIFREGRKEPLEIIIKRDVIDIPVLDTEWQDNIFIIRLYNFSANSDDLFREAIRKFIQSNKRDKKMILDLRGNPGGFLSASVDISSWFLEAGKVVVKEDFGDKQEDVLYRSKGYNVFGKDFEMVVLIDGGSASASEIVAGALQEYGIATLVGSQSFGKGSVQELVKVTPETSLKITVARWITPEGHSISLEGLTPDVEVEVTEEDIKADRDPVLEKALEILK
jgi:carboxyl-terminal processing protease